MNALRTFFVFIIACVLCGCAAVPSQVVLPKHLDVTDVDANGRPSTGSSEAGKRFNKRASDMGIQPVATTRKTLLYQLNTLIGEWNSEADSLLLGRDVVDNVNFLGIVTGAGLVLADQIKAAKGVAALVAGTNLAADNYKIIIQASNYSTAAEAVECVRTQVLEVSESAWATFFDVKGDVKDTFEMESDQRSSLQATFPRINGAMSSIYKKLRSNQRAVRVTAPTADAISKAISDTQKQIGVVENLATKSAIIYGVGSGISLTEYQLTMLKQLLAVSGNAQTCATAMGS